MVLGTLLGVSWTPLETLLGGVFWPLGSFGIFFGRPRASQIFVRRCARPSRRPSWMLLQWFFDEVAPKFAKNWPLGRIFVATMLWENDFNRNYNDFGWNSDPPNIKFCNTLQHFNWFLYFSLHRFWNPCKRSKMILGTLLGISWTPNKRPRQGCKPTAADVQAPTWAPKWRSGPR